MSSELTTAPQERLERSHAMRRRLYPGQLGEPCSFIAIVSRDRFVQIAPIANRGSPEHLCYREEGCSAIALDFLTFDDRSSIRILSRNCPRNLLVSRPEKRVPRATHRREAWRYRFGFYHPPARHFRTNLTFYDITVLRLFCKHGDVVKLNPFAGTNSFQF